MEVSGSDACSVHTWQFVHGDRKIFEEANNLGWVPCPASFHSMIELPLTRLRTIANCPRIPLRGAAS